MLMRLYILTLLDRFQVLGLSVRSRAKKKRGFSFLSSVLTLSSTLSSRIVIQASFSYIGTEIVAIAAGETKDPRKTLPRAIKVSTSPAALRPSSPTLSPSLLTLLHLQNVYIRILFFYLLVSRPPIQNRPSERELTPI